MYANKQKMDEKEKLLKISSGERNSPQSKKTQSIPK